MYLYYFRTYHYFHILNILDVNTTFLFYLLWLVSFVFKLPFFRWWNNWTHLLSVVFPTRLLRFINSRSYQKIDLSVIYYNSVFSSSFIWLMPRFMMCTTSLIRFCRHFQLSHISFDRFFVLLHVSIQ